MIQLSISETVTEKWYSYWKVIQLSKSEQLSKSDTKVILSKSETVIEKWYSYRKWNSDKSIVIEKWYSYRKVIEKWYTKVIQYR